jgi:Na+/H+ antiporter NhaD/arsenite permease-like protein
VSLVKHKLIVAALTASLAAIDLIEKALDPTQPFDYHARSATWAVGSGALVLAAFALSFLRSRAVAVSAGIMAGGVLANLVSAIAGGGRVPNPIVAGSERDGIAFNLADVFTLIGLFALIVSVCVVLVVHRERLLPPRAWERALWRKVRGR